MTFTYTPSTPTDVTRVRFHIGDVDSTVAMFTDEEITFRIAETGTWKTAVVDCLGSLIARLSMEGEFTAGWLTVRKDVALRNFEMLLKIKRNEFGIPLITASAVYLYRPDNTNFTEAPTFSESEDDD